MIQADKVLKPSPLPGVKGLVLDTPQGHRESAGAFHEMDKNCNTCRYLRRVATPKEYRVTGLLLGLCGRQDGHPYQPTIMFAPADYQGTGCWEARSADNNK